MLVVSVTRNFENIHYQYLAGGITDSAWNGWSARMLGFFGQPGIQPWWEDHKAAYSTEFQQFVENGRANDTETPSPVLKPAPPNQSLEPDT